MGINIRVIGEQAGHFAPRPDGKRIIFVANHSSWLDIVVLGKVLPTCFVAKGEVKKWPFIGFLSKIAGTVYTTRDPQDASQNVNDIRTRLEEGRHITFFPEGTTSDGRSVLPFISSLFAVTKPLRSRRESPDVAAPPLLIQPISIAYDQLEGLPVGRTRRISVFSWFGDMYLAPHVWALGKWRSMRASVLFHDPLDPEDFPSRKTLSNAAYNVIRQGNEDLRHHRITSP